MITMTEESTNPVRCFRCDSKIMKILPGYIARILDYRKNISVMNEIYQMTSSSRSKVTANVITSVYEISFAVSLFIVIDAICLIGNVMVILAVLTAPNLNAVQNYLIVSLACADLACSILLMPFHITTYIKSNNWIFGFHMCRMFVLCDMCLCTASIINLCIISVDRCIAMMQPIKHTLRRTRSNTMLAIAIAWSVSFLICIPLFFLDHEQLFRLVQNSGGGGEDGLTTTNHYECKMSTNKLFVVFSSSVSFYIPATLICYVNAVIYTRTIRRLRTKSKRATQLAKNANKLKSVTGKSVDAQCEERLITTDHSQQGVALVNNACDMEARDPVADSLRRQEHAAKAREWRLTVTLGVIVIAFIACWSPFFILYVLTAFFPKISDKIDNRVNDVVLWLGYINSASNPLVYTAFNVDFRMAFMHLLRLDRFLANFRK